MENQSGVLIKTPFPSAIDSPVVLFVKLLMKPVPYHVCIYVAIGDFNSLVT